jgi:hypothetical protein
MGTGWWMYTFDRAKWDAIFGSRWSWPRRSIRMGCVRAGPANDQLNGSIIFILHRVFSETRHPPLLPLKIQTQTPQRPPALLARELNERGPDRWDRT